MVYVKMAVNQTNKNEYKELVDMDCFYINHSICQLKVEMAGNKVTEIVFADNIEDSDVPERWKPIYTEIVEYLEGNRKEFTFEIEPKGTDFQKKTWKALRDIPYGETRTYKEIARAIGNEKACRAVGLANNRNPIVLAIPCHRVIGSNGKLVGFGGGLDVKEELLNLEKENA